MNRVTLTRGLEAIVDDEDYARLSQYRWHALRARQKDERWYAVRQLNGGKVLMHRVVLGLPPGRVPEVDHLNGDGLDNRKANLRVASRSENARNRSKPASGASRTGRRWRAQVVLNGQYRHLGMFATREEAESAYRDAAFRAESQT